MSKPTENYELPWSGGWSVSLVLRAAGASLVALLELFLARLRFVRFHVSQIETFNKRSAQKGRGPDQMRPEDRDRLAMIAAIVPRIAYRLPWRSDCLVQATAAQRWLSRLGIASRIAIGVDTGTHAGFEAHAWLAFGEFIVCGGDLGRYTVLLDSVAEAD